MGNNLIKFIQRKWSNESPRGIPVTVRLSPIFKMNVHCFDELFEYLSLKDLISLAQTCTSIQEMAGKFFKRNYSAAKFICLRDGIYMIYRETPHHPNKCIPIPCFIEFITWVDIGNNIIASIEIKRINELHTTNTVYYDDLDIKLKYIRLHADELKSVKRLSLTKVCLDRQTVECILKILANIEVLELAHSNVNRDLYDVLLKYCKNVRRLELTVVELKNNYKWLLRKYEKLEHLQLSGTNSSSKIDELCEFFKINPSVHSFSCDLPTLWSNKDSLLNSVAKIDTFKLIFLAYKGYDEICLSSLWDILHGLHAHGFYKRLHINTYSHQCDQLPVMPFLEKISLQRYNNDPETLSSRLLECTEISLNDDISKIPVQNLINMKRLYLKTELCTNINLVIKQLRNLKEIKLVYFMLGRIFELDMLNEERGKLIGAQKVTIYVQDEVFLATKWATKNGNTNFPLIEMKRIGSVEWNGPTCSYISDLYLSKITKNS